MPKINEVATQTCCWLSISSLTQMMAKPAMRIERTLHAAAITAFGKKPVSWCTATSRLCPLFAPEMASRCAQLTTNVDVVMQKTPHDSAIAAVTK